MGKAKTNGHAFLVLSREPYMRGAFVIRLALEAQLTKHRLEGWVEEVDSGKELRFRSADELLQFLTQCIHAALLSRSERDELMPPSGVE